LFRSAGWTVLTTDPNRSEAVRGLKWVRFAGPRTRGQTGLSDEQYAKLIADRRRWQAQLRRALELTLERFELDDNPGTVQDSGIGYVVVGPKSDDYPLPEPK
jgi:hypothetical protein